jgi:MarR family transcriptional regulator, organic hydroperoxide resistance regulator
MDIEQRIDLIRQVMGASHIFCSSVNELLERTLAEASDEALAMSQVKLLLLISRPEQRFKVTDVAEFLGVTNAAASRAIERLVQRGLVDRTVSRDDRRAVDLSLTPQSRELLDRFTEVRNRELLQLLAHYPEDKLRKVVTLLDELSVLLLDFESGTDDRCLRCGIHFRSGCVLRDVLGRECAVASGLYGEPHDDDDDAHTGGRAGVRNTGIGG